VIAGYSELSQVLQGVRGVGVEVLRQFLAEPRVLERLLWGDAVGRVVGQETIDEVLGVRGDLAPVFFGEGELAVEDLL